MNATLRLKWKAYAIEAWALGMFMISASLFVILIEHPNFYIATLIPNAHARRMLIGLAMGLTAIALIYSKWGKMSGAHMNPAVTLANYQLDRISLQDAVGYIVAQFLGSSLAMLALKTIINDYLSHPSVNYVVTQPGMHGVLSAAMGEFCISFFMFLSVLILSNSSISKYTGYFAGFLVFIFISVEAPVSGMSMNPARSFGSAIASMNWSHFWIYLVSPVLGMQFAAYLFRTFYFSIYWQCKTMKCFMSGEQHDNEVYHVYKWTQMTKTGEVKKKRHQTTTANNSPSFLSKKY